MIKKDLLSKWTTSRINTAAPFQLSVPQTFLYYDEPKSIWCNELERR